MGGFVVGAVLLWLGTTFGMNVLDVPRGWVIYSWIAFPLAVMLYHAVHANKHRDQDVIDRRADEVSYNRSAARARRFAPTAGNYAGTTHSVRNYMHVWLAVTGVVALPYYLVRLFGKGLAGVIGKAVSRLWSKWQATPVSPGVPAQGVPAHTPTHPARTPKDSPIQDVATHGLRAQYEALVWRALLDPSQRNATEAEAASLLTRETTPAERHAWEQWRAAMMTYYWATPEGAQALERVRAERLEGA